jgi:hypothetical protein
MASKERFFTTEEICSIINTCSSNGVRRFLYQGLDLSFVPVEQSPAIDPVFIPEPLKQKSISQAREASEQEEVKYKAEELDLMQIEDPLRYEELLKSGDLVDEET